MAIMSFLDQGLNFSIHADAAWGAYFASMLRDPPPGQSKQNVEDEAFVPELSLSEYVIKQMEVFLVLKQQYLSFRGLSSFFFNWEELLGTNLELQVGGRRGTLVCRTL